ncbi:hypothetical protein AZE42_06287 [Rhizopogon vesiculosus]|uniref:Uncharacterized protein n=1 Tax=Rhizopogon vesiculosus TaxID=180088 RepID=A0A1J8QD59_9AGAM|nr:hypothetical protein AZE42_06287 [Rhizopogon vesiculosus]
MQQPAPEVPGLQGSQTLLLGLPQY